MKNNWLWHFRKNVYSQCGEDGIIDKILETIGVRHKYVVEFGAWDGVHNSNSRLWLGERGWSGVVIEGDTEKCARLAELYKDRPDVTALEAFVSRDPSLTQILDRAKTPKDFDLCSIDIDGNDYWIWKEFTAYRPRVVIVEVNSAIPPNVLFVPKYDARGAFAASLRGMIELGKQKGYSLAAYLMGNCIFVVDEEFRKLGIEDNSPESMFNSPYVPVMIADQAGNHFILRYASCYGPLKTVNVGIPPAAEVCQIIDSEEQIQAQAITRAS